MVEDKVSDDRTLQQYEEERTELRQQVAFTNAKYENLQEEFVSSRRHRCLHASCRLVQRLLTVQGRMEEEVMDKTTKLERIHGTVSELERRNKALIKRQAVQVRLDSLRGDSIIAVDGLYSCCVDQEESFELERRDRADMERTFRNRVDDLEAQLKRHLASQVDAESAIQNTILEQDISTTHDQHKTEEHLLAQAKIVAQLRSRMADMSESQLSLTEKHTSLSLHIHTLEHEVAERTAECYRLREENEGFEILLRERTLDGRVYDADIFGEGLTDEDEMSDSTVESDTDSQAGLKTDKKVIGVDGRHSSTPQEREQPRSSRRRKALNLAEELEKSIASIDLHPGVDGEDNEGNNEEEQAAQAEDASASVLESKSFLHVHM